MIWYIIGLGVGVLAGYSIWHKYTKTYWPWEVPPPPVVPVVPPVAPKLEVVSIALRPSEILLGETVHGSVIVRNVGAAPGAGSVLITANGAIITRLKTPAISPAAETTLDFRWTPPVAKAYTVCAELV